MRRIYLNNSEKLSEFVRRASNLAFQVNEFVEICYNGVNLTVSPESDQNDILYIYGLKTQVRSLSHNFRY